MVLVAQSCLTLCDPTDRSPPASSVHGILQVRILEPVAIPFSRGSSWPRDQTWLSCIADRFFIIWPEACSFLPGQIVEELFLTANDTIFLFLCMHSYLHSFFLYFQFNPLSYVSEKLLINSIFAYNFIHTVSRALLVTCLFTSSAGLEFLEGNVWILSAECSACW